MTIYEMTRKDFEKIPHRKFGEQIKCDSIVLLPLRSHHSSGFRNIDFIAVDDKGKPICSCSGCSDVIHFNDEFWTISNSGCKIDCLGKSGLFRIFPTDPSMKIIIGIACSDALIWTIKEKGGN